MPVESQRRSGVKTVASGSRITTGGTALGSANPPFFPAASSVTPTRCAHSAPESVVGTATCAGYPSCRATAFVPSTTLPPPTLTSRSAPADSASPAASSTALPGVCSPMPACVPACLSPSSASTLRTRSVFSLRVRPVTTKARPWGRASSWSFRRLPGPKWTLAVRRNVCVPPIMPAVYRDSRQLSAVSDEVKAGGRRNPRVRIASDPATREERGLLGDAAPEVPRRGELLLGRLLGAAGAVGVAAGLEEHGVGVARGHEDGAPVREHVVQGEERGLLPAVRVRGAREAADDLVRELALEPEPARRVDELLELRRDVPETRRGPEDVGVGPLEVLKLCLRHVFRHERVVGPALVALDGLLRRQLAHLAETDLGPGLLSALLDGPRQLVDVARRAVVDHRYFGRHACSFGCKWTRVHFKNRGYRGRLELSRERGGAGGATT